MISIFEEVVMFVDSDNMSNVNIPPNAMIFLKNFLKCKLRTIYIAGNNDAQVKRWGTAAKNSFKNSHIEAVTVGPGKNKADMQIIFEIGRLSDNEAIKNNCHIIILTGDKLILRAAERLQEKGFTVIVMTACKASLSTKTSLPIMIFQSLAGKIKEGNKKIILNNEKQPKSISLKITLEINKVKLLKTIIDKQENSVSCKILTTILINNGFNEHEATEILISMGFDEVHKPCIGKKKLIKWFDNALVHSIST